MYNFLLVPKASYAVPSNEFQANCALATPIKVVVETFSQPPIFSGKPYRKRTLSPSIHLPLDVISVFCLSKPG